METKKIISQLKQYCKKENIIYEDLLLDIHNNINHHFDHLDNIKVIVSNELNDYMMVEITRNLNKEFLREVYSNLSKKYSKSIKVSYEKNKGVSESIYDEIYNSLYGSIPEDYIDIIIHDFLKNFLK